MGNKSTQIINWRGTDIQITTSAPIYSNAFKKVYGYQLMHIEVKTINPEKAPLPITNTGYKSIYITEPELHSCGGSVQLILDEINASANSPEWKELDFKARQYSLF